MTDNYYDIIVVGDLVQNDLIFAEHLSRLGFNVAVLRKNKSKENEIKAYDNYFEKFDTKQIIYYKNIVKAINTLMKANLIVSFTGRIIGIIKWMLLFIKILRLPPIINITTGSDVTELLKDKSLKAIIYRLHLKKVNLNWCVTYPYSLENLINRRVKNIVFMKFPYYSLLNYKNNIEENELKDNRYISLFHPSNIDYGINDSNKNRNSTKGNDKFILAFSKAIKNGLNAKCTFLERGPDVNHLKNLIITLEIEKSIIWKKHLTQKELFNEMFNSDIIVDQFDVGGFGAIAMEAMSMGKPVLVYIDKNVSKLLYNGDIPILNAMTEEEIYIELSSITKEKLNRIGKMAKKWFIENHHWENCMDSFIFYYSLLTGKKIIDYTKKIEDDKKLRYKYESSN